MVECISSAIQFITTFAAIIIIEKYFIIPIIIVYSIAVFVFIKVIKVFDKIDEERENLKHKRSVELEKVILGFNELRSFGTEQYHLEQMRNVNNEYNCLTIKRRKIQAFGFNGTFELVDTILLLLVLAFAIIYVPKGKVLDTTAVALIMYVGD